MPKSRCFFGRHWRAAAFESDPRTKMARTTSTNDNAVISPLHLATLERASQNNTSSASVICLLWVNCRDPAVIREGQLHPSKPTNPPARSIVSSMPKADFRRFSPNCRRQPTFRPRNLRVGNSGTAPCCHKSGTTATAPMSRVMGLPTIVASKKSGGR